jgi:GYF domain
MAGTIQLHGHNTSGTVAESCSECLPAARMWEYQDLDGQTHGPFSSDKMRQWTAKGYFQSDLQAVFPTTRYYDTCQSSLAIGTATCCC